MTVSEGMRVSACVSACQCVCEGNSESMCVCGYVSEKDIILWKI